ncbi:hypothetical protein AVEN_53327-1 [Araneus ventricosus]|uniref:Uncharacterized protein n=1 Tax=Araneus ventricosus TaxID=182803 RepID=A0A4Y2AAL4_ARAVE|nr:hypothetical protein AVEN_53327-1 [Araneus ventricosus]
MACSAYDTTFGFTKLLGILKTRTILNHLSLFVSKNQTHCDTHLPLFLLAYRSVVDEVIGFTSSEILFIRTLRLPCDILFGRLSDTPTSKNEYMNNLEFHVTSRLVGKATNTEVLKRV